MKSSADASDESDDFVYRGVSSLIANKNYIYRGLALGEMEQILKTWEIRPKCGPCTETDILSAKATTTTEQNKKLYPKCCLFTAEEHVRTGTYNSSYVSFSKQAELLFDWQTRPAGSGIIAVVDTTGLDIIDTADLNWGEKWGRPKTDSKAVLEVLVKGSIPANSIVAFLSVKKIPIHDVDVYKLNIGRLIAKFSKEFKAHNIRKVVQKKYITNEAQLLTEKYNRRDAEYLADKKPIPKGERYYPADITYYCVEQIPGINIVSYPKLPPDHVFYSPGSNLVLEPTLGSFASLGNDEVMEIPDLSRTLNTTQAQNDPSFPEYDEVAIRSPPGLDIPYITNNPESRSPNRAETKSSMGGKRTCKSFCDDYYLPHMEKVYKRQTEKLIKRYPGMVETKINTKLRKQVCMNSFCTPCITKLNRKKTKKFKKFKKRGALFVCDPSALF